LIVFLFLLLSLDSDTFYLMDESITLFPTNEETLYTGSRRAFRIVQGFSINDKWRYRYEAKFEIPLSSELSFYYRLHKEEMFGLNEELHRFELNWIPRSMNLPPWTYSFVIAPSFHSGNSKIRLDLLGCGFGYWKNLSNNHSFYLIFEDFHHRNRYSRLPIRLELEGKLRNNWASLSYYYRYTLPGKKDFPPFVEVLEKFEHGDKVLSISSHYHLLKNLSLGLRFRYLELDSTFASYDFEENFFQWERFFTEPYIEIRLFERDNIRIGLPMNYKRIFRDTLDYEGKGIGFTFLYNYRVCDWLMVPIGIQKLWRRLNREQSQELRGVLGIEFRFKKKTYISIRKGIEFDPPLSSILKNPQNHTFLMLSHRF